jgi:hypothetical protein
LREFEKENPSRRISEGLEARKVGKRYYSRLNGGSRFF